MPRIHFLGAAGTVTGSRFLVEGRQGRVLVDCGLFQGPSELRERNWARLEVGALDAVVLTHAHLDHSGWLPRLVREGFRGKVWVTPPTAELAAILLRDAAWIAEEDARRLERREGIESAPLYTVADAEDALTHLAPHAFREEIEIAPGISLHFRRAGHILGAAHVRLTVDGVRVVFSGDVGRYEAPLLRDPQPFDAADVLVVESTYGDRAHRATDPTEELASVLARVAERGGITVLPAFAVGRTQDILWRLRRLEDAGRLGEMEVVLDSPMAVDVTGLYGAHPSELDPELVRAPGFPESLFPRRLRFARSVDESKALRGLTSPALVLSASGMCTGGRVLHHLSQRLEDPRNAVCIVGFMPIGTLGRQLLDGAEEVRIHGRHVAVEAEIVKINALSAHADRVELGRWLDSFATPPARTFVVHGEPPASAALAADVAARGWAVEVAAFGQIAEV